jgi:hypothetical protein
MMILPVEGGNRAVKDGSLPKIMQSLMEKTKPEASYFGAEDGNRTAYIFFDFHDVSDMPNIAEPLFTSLDAKIELTPVMNAEDLKKGLEKAAK